MHGTAMQVNPGSTPRIREVGKERTPVVVIDDFAMDVNEIVEHACSSAIFGTDRTSAYPGVRAPLIRPHVVAELKAVYPLLCETYSIPAYLRMRPVNAVYSLISTPEHELRLLQRLPHFDSSNPYYFAITHFINPGEFGGTGFYRHRPTGFETVTAARLAEYIKAGDEFLAENGDPEPHYFGVGDEHFELYDQVDYKTNRLVLYPGYLLHSGMVDPARDINSDPAMGRLTSNVFVDFQ